MKIAITVVVGVYNTSEFIAETIKSVLQQTYTDFELLLIDDGSTDDTADIVRNFCEQDSRVKLISQENQGVSVARNTGINMAQGEFIAILDADDLWLPNKLAMHIQHFSTNPNLGLSFGRIEFMTFDGKPTGKYSNPRFKNITPKNLYEENPTSTPSNAVIRKVALQQVGGFDKDLRNGLEDIELFLRLCCHGWQVEGIEEVLVLYRTSIGGMSSQLYKMEKAWKELNQKAQAYAPDLIEQYYNHANAMFLRYLARRTLRLNLSSDVGISYINRALQSEWTLIFKEPRRTTLTMIAVYGKHLMPTSPNKSTKSSIN